MLTRAESSEDQIHGRKAPEHAEDAEDSDGTRGGGDTCLGHGVERRGAVARDGGPRAADKGRAATFGREP